MQFIQCQMQSFRGADEGGKYI